MSNLLYIILGIGTSNLLSLRIDLSILHIKGNLTIIGAIIKCRKYKLIVSNKNSI